MWKPSFFGIALVVVGVLYLLNQFHLLPNVWNWGDLWPLLVFAVGLAGFGHDVRRRRFPWWPLFFVAWGGVMFLRNATTFVPALAHLSGTAYFTSLFLIFLGLSILMPKRFGRTRHRVIRARKRWKGIDVDATLDMDDIRDSIRDWRSRSGRVRRTVGDISIGAQPWVLKDLNLWNAVGDVRLNLATAQVEDGTYRIDVGGLIGDIRILVPASIAVSVDCKVRIGDVNLFDTWQSGLGRHMEYADQGFDEAPKKLIIQAELMIGDISVLRV